MPCQRQRLNTPSAPDRNQFAKDSLKMTSMYTLALELVVASKVDEAPPPDRMRLANNALDSDHKSSS